jgi:hypothetical protein
MVTERLLCRSADSELHVSSLACHWPCFALACARCLDYNNGLFLENIDSNTGTTHFLANNKNTIQRDLTY